MRIGSLPELVRGLTISVKTYERLTIRAAIEKQRSLAVLALFANPIVGDWDTAQAFVDKLVESDRDHFDYR
jgi:6-phospho-beta-glucosidase